MASLFTELKRRNVIRVALFYAVASWLLLQVADILLETLDVPQWGMRLILVVLIIGFPLAMIFSWVFEMTPEGIKRESAIDQSRPVATARKLDFAVIFLLVISMGMFVADRFFSGQADEPGFEAAGTGTPGGPGVSLEPDAGVPTQTSLAVLPFVNMSGDKENEYFADGLSEELLNRLAQLPELLVAGRTSSFAFKGESQDLRKIGEFLGVTNILEGSVRRQSERVRVTAQLIRVKDGFHLWSETYDRTLEDIFAVQDDIAENVARAMDVVLDENKREKMRSVGVRNVDAFVAYQKGYELYLQGHERDLLPTLRRGVVFFEEATRLAPKFGEAYFASSDYYAHIMLDWDTTVQEKTEALEKYRAVLDAAYTNTPDPQRRALIDVDRTLFSDDWRQFGNVIQRAITEPGCASPIWLEVAQAWGFDGFESVYRRAWECDPLAFSLAEGLASSKFYAGDAQAALEIVDAAYEKIGYHPWLGAVRTYALMMQGRFDEAREEASRITPDVEFYGDMPIRVEAAAGNLEEARRLAAAWPHSGGFSDHLSVLAGLGDREGANALAAKIDAEPAGAARLAIFLPGCACGAPWDIEVTPNFKKRLDEAGFSWPPPTLIKYPAKDW